MLLERIRNSSERKRLDGAWLPGFVATAITPEPLLAALNDYSASDFDGW